MGCDEQDRLLLGATSSTVDQRALVRDRHGRIHATFGIDALRAYEIGLLGEERYKRSIRRLDDAARRFAVYAIGKSR